MPTACLKINTVHQTLRWPKVQLRGWMTPVFSKWHCDCGKTTTNFWSGQIPTAPHIFRWPWSVNARGYSTSKKLASFSMQPIYYVYDVLYHSPVLNFHRNLSFLCTGELKFTLTKISNVVSSKGQLISKANFKVFIWTVRPTKIFLYFCPSFKKPLKSGWNKR